MYVCMYSYYYTCACCTIIYCIINDYYVYTCTDDEKFTKLEEPSWMKEALLRDAYASHTETDAIYIHRYVAT